MKKMGRPNVDTQPVTVRLHSDLIAELDEARKNEADLPTRPEMIRRMIDDWFRLKKKTD